MLTVLDIDEADVESAAIISEWEAEFRERFNAPMAAAASIIELMSLPPEAIEWLRLNKPDDFARANRYVKQLQASVQGG
jgi:hypothetical protein